MGYPLPALPRQSGKDVSARSEFVGSAVRLMDNISQPDVQKVRQTKPSMFPALHPHLRTNGRGNNKEAPQGCSTPKFNHGNVGLSL